VYSVPFNGLIVILTFAKAGMASTRGCGCVLRARDTLLEERERERKARTNDGE